jgi:hypothetical protein
MFVATFLGALVNVLWITLLVAVWIGLAILPATIARSKGHSFWGWFFLSLFFWWITLFVVLFMHDNTHPTASPGY